MYCYRYFVSRCDFHLVAFHLYLCSFIAWKLSLEFSILCVSTSVKRDIVGIDENNSPPSMELMCLSFHRKVSSSDELMKFAFWDFLFLTDVSFISVLIIGNGQNLLLILIIVDHLSYSYFSSFIVLWFSWMKYRCHICLFIDVQRLLWIVYDQELICPTVPSDPLLRENIQQ